MATATLTPDQAKLVQRATDPATTPFDYIIVGSGAGGGPLAARLALCGRRVLVIESGNDPALDDAGNPRIVHEAPVYHGSATEDDESSWSFSVRHYGDTARQQRDSKYDPARDPSLRGDAAKGGIFYPRAAAIGGCTSHHAMIVIRPNDSDWDEIARLTGDESWRAETMQGYFPRIEQCLYYAAYSGFLAMILGGLLRVTQWIATLINPRSQLDPGGHGFSGWQPTSFIDPIVIAGIARGDCTFLRLLFSVIWSALSQRSEKSILKRALGRLQLIQFLDPNVRDPNFTDRAHISLISIGTDGKRRVGVREWLLHVGKEHPDRLVIKTGAHATRLIFARDSGDPTPRAVGVEVALGENLYRASPKNSGQQPTATQQLYARHEIIVAGGSFNSPQLLMLSGIGEAGALQALGIQGPRDASDRPLGPIVNLPGIGRNLQDRYEVSVISETTSAFSTLKGATFDPNDTADPMRQQWIDHKSGLYATNGGAVAMMVKSQNRAGKDDDPDLFIFGAPAAFRGYYWGWSKELLFATKGAGTLQRNLWSWVILKAYTQNNAGTVSLRSDRPFDTPEINFNSFPNIPGARDDIGALTFAVSHMRAINARISVMKTEIQPGPTRPDGSADLRDWVQDEAWGHHACGTCRIGQDDWVADTAALTDKGAVLDSRFKVHGVHNLRVVDASVFPKIPGYFIVTPVFMVAEKAADTILADSTDYPPALARREAAAVHRRRQLADGIVTAAPVPKTLPADCIGLALSGGGIRSATYCLGFLQALAGADVLKRIDILSTVSGGGFIGGFLGRLYSRLDDVVGEKAKRIREILTDNTAAELWWLRQHADYIGGAGRSDLEANLAIFARNLASVYLAVGGVLIAAFGALRWITDRYPRIAPIDWQIAGIQLSPWWILPAAVLVLALIPLAAGYWLAPNGLNKRPYPSVTILIWVILLGGAIALLGLHARLLGALAIVVLLLAWLWQEIARWRVREETLDPLTAALLRNRLTRMLGGVILLFAALSVFVVIDSFARAASDGSWGPVVSLVMAAAAPFLPWLKSVAISLVPGRVTAEDSKMSDGMRTLVFAVLAFGLAASLTFAIDTAAHSAFKVNHALGVWVVIVGAIASAVLGRATPFINLSSLHAALTQKLTRTFLGASNDRRVHPSPTFGPKPIQVVDAEDDQRFIKYHPEAKGGPLHLINVCANQTVDRLSGRELRNNKGLSMCLGPGGISVGRRYHALWQADEQGIGQSDVAVEALPVSPDPNAFHVLARSDGKPARVEDLSLGHWLAISAASLTTGSGRYNSLPMSLLLGLLNVRLGFWWNSGIDAGKRPGRYPPDLWRRIKGLPAAIFAVQAMLLNEWRGYFAGPAVRRWYLSDGGHFDNTGLYELIRRRLPFIIAVDAGQDQSYELGDLAILTRQVRLDFGANVEWLEPAKVVAAGTVPGWIGALLNLDTIGALDKIKRDSTHCAALARITYDGAQGAESWLLMVKPNLASLIQVDVRNYATVHPVFPNETTADQFFDDAQWESYRSLGERAGRTIFK